MYSSEKFRGVIFALASCLIYFGGLRYPVGIHLDVVTLAISVVVFCAIFFTIHATSSRLNRLAATLDPRVLTGTILASLAVVVLSLWSEMQSPDFFYYNFLDRDLWRGMQILHDPFINGPELNRDFRTPGGFLYFVIRSIQTFSLEPEQIYIASIGLRILGALFVFLAVSSISTLGGGAVAATIFIISPITRGSNLALWNPSFLALPSGLAAYLLVKIADRVTPGRLVLFGFVSGAAAQFHLSFLSVLIASLIALSMFKTYRQAKIFFLVGVGLGLAYLPFIIGEIRSNFELTFSIFGQLGDPLVYIGKTEGLRGDRFVVTTFILNTLKYVALAFRQHESIDASLGLIGSRAAYLFYPFGLFFLGAVGLRVIYVFFNRIMRRNELAAAERAEVILLITFLCHLFFQFIFLNNTMIHHFFAAVATVGALMGLSFARVFDGSFLEKFVSNVGLVQLALCLSFVSWAVPQGTWKILAPKGGPLVGETYTQKNRMLNDFANRLKADTGSFEYKAGLFVYNPQTDTTTATYWHMAYLSRIRANKQMSGGGFKGCAAYIWILGEEPGFEQNKIWLEKSHLSLKNYLEKKVGATDLTDLGFSGPFRMYSYNTPDGNCLKSAKNRYVMDEFEAAVYEARKENGAAITESAPIGDFDRRFVVWTTKNKSLGLGVSVKQSAKRLILQLDSNHLGGASDAKGIENNEWILNKPRFHLVSNSDPEKKFEAGDISEVGSRYDGTLTPWLFIFEGLPLGTYSLSLTARADRKFVTYVFLEKDVPIFVKIAEDVSIK